MGDHQVRCDVRPESHVPASAVTGRDRTDHDASRLEYVQVVSEEVRAELETFGQLLRRAIADDQLLGDRQAGWLAEGGMNASSPTEIRVDERLTHDSTGSVHATCIESITVE